MTYKPVPDRCPYCGVPLPSYAVLRLEHKRNCSQNPEKIKHMEEAIKKFVESMDAEPTIERSDDE